MLFQAGRPLADRLTLMGLHPWLVSTAPPGLQALPILSLSSVTSAANASTIDSTALNWSSVPCGNTPAEAAALEVSCSTAPVGAALASQGCSPWRAAAAPLTPGTPRQFSSATFLCDSVP